ncbi:hypothetical protein BASA50_006325 [Batrachochytrium salamandrivorans]|uniref:Uncharacterized protein n=1 Tax=Batrachochytrium salamandrivorans TaxID=1357716 RepID=A0ABQ8FAF3_9FUNG|nr:hypothetical protein BASA60_005489 [Batrachochytrium salamandrivorans]KAH6594851.1 hypothetical protein BASA50_006325 [Batrachochytrium salamandrivorans]KAH9267101.1 hypothetical protein BASA84_000827 [Batrachochytrium salamandrivorans]
MNGMDRRYAISECASYDSCATLSSETDDTLFQSSEDTASEKLLYTSRYNSQCVTWNNSDNIQDQTTSKIPEHIVSRKIKTELRALQATSAEHMATVQSNFDEYAKRIHLELAELDVSRRHLNESFQMRAKNSRTALIIKDAPSNCDDDTSVNDHSMEVPFSPSVAEKHRLWQEKQQYGRTSEEAHKKWVQYSETQMLQSREIRQRAADSRRDISIMSALKAQKKYRVDLYGVDPY